MWFSSSGNKNMVTKTANITKDDITLQQTDIFWRICGPCELALYNNNNNNNNNNNFANVLHKSFHLL